MNREAENIFGYPAGELVEKGASIKILVRPKYHADFDAQWQALIRTRESVAGLKISNPRRDGNTA